MRRPKRSSNGFTSGSIPEKSSLWIRRTETRQSTETGSVKGGGAKRNKGKQGQRKWIINSPGFLDQERKASVSLHSCWSYSAGPSPGRTEDTKTNEESHISQVLQLIFCHTCPFSLFCLELSSLAFNSYCHAMLRITGRRTAFNLNGASQTSLGWLRCPEVFFSAGKRTPTQMVRTKKKDDGV